MSVRGNVLLQGAGQVRGELNPLTPDRVAECAADHWGVDELVNKWTLHSVIFGVSRWMHL